MDNQERLEVFRRIKDSLAQGWCQGDMAKNEHGFPVAIRSTDACQWCLLGAIKKAVLPDGPVNATKAFGTEYQDQVHECCDIIRGVTHKPIDITMWNDYYLRTQDEVIEVVDEVIRQLENGFTPVRVKAYTTP